MLRCIRAKSANIMIHFGLICPEGGGHLNPFMALAAELRPRGHRVTFYLRPLGVANVRAAGFDCPTYGERKHSADESRAHLRAMAKKRRFAALPYTVGRLRTMISAALAELPRLARAGAVDVIIVDDAVVSIVATVAEVLRIPYAVFEHHAELR
ncbi:MAG: hypothetical protein H7Z14_12540 [Anaerolineae bacterium]|nr:hypothetical protein [Phycisphaerae bacterium]